MAWIGGRTILPIIALLSAILANLLLVGVLAGSGGGIAHQSPRPPAWNIESDGVQFGEGTLREDSSQSNPYVLKITEPTTENPKWTSAGQIMRVSFTFSKGTEPVNEELADIAVPWLSVDGRPCLVTKGPSEGFARDVSRLPEPMYDAGAATVGGKAYLVGGRNESGRLDSILEFDPVSNTTKVVHNLPVALRWTRVVAIGEKIYILGGVDRDGSVVSTIRAYDPMDNTSQVVGDLPGARYWGAAAVAGNMIYYGGGRDGRIVSDAIFQFDPSTGGARQVSTLPLPTSILTAATAYGKVYFIGGLTPGPEFQISDIVEYDAVANTSTVVATFPPPIGSDGLEAQTAVTLNGKVYIFNGWDEGATPKFRNEVYEFDPLGGEDAVLVGTLPHEVERGEAVAIHGRAYLFGGATGNGIISAITEFSPGGATATFNLSLQQWQATCSLPQRLRGPGPLDLFVQARITDHATGLSFIVADEEKFAVLINSRDGRPPPYLCIEPPSLPRADANPADNHGVATWLSRRGSPEAALPPYCLEV